MTRQQNTNVASQDEMIKRSIVHVFFFLLMSNTSHRFLKHEPASNITHDNNVENHEVWLAELYLQLCTCFFFDATLEMPCHSKTSRTLSRMEDTWRMDYITSRRYQVWLTLHDKPTKNKCRFTWRDDKEIYCTCLLLFLLMSNTSHRPLKHEPASNITRDINVENHAVWLAELYLQLCACFFFDATLEMPCHSKTSRTLSKIEDTWRMDCITPRQDNKEHITRWCINKVVMCTCDLFKFVYTVSWE